MYSNLSFCSLVNCTIEEDFGAVNDAPSTGTRSLDATLVFRVGTIMPRVPIVNACAYPNSTRPMFYRDLAADCRYIGILVEIAELTLRQLGWYYEVIPLEGTLATYGAKQPNGSYSSYLKYLQEGEVDMIVGDFSVTEQRLQDFDMLRSPV